MKSSILASLACDAVSVRSTASDGAGSGNTAATLDAQKIGDEAAAILGAFYPGPTPRTYVVIGNSPSTGIKDLEEVRFFSPGCASGPRRFVLESQIVCEQILDPCPGGKIRVELVVSY